MVRPCVCGCVFVGLFGSVIVGVFGSVIVGVIVVVYMCFEGVCIFACLQKYTQTISKQAEQQHSLNDPPNSPSHPHPTYLE